MLNLVSVGLALVRPSYIVEMTAVLQATDALRRDRLMASLDDNQIKYEPVTSVTMT